MKALFSYAFRPFFLLNSILAVVAVAIWLSALYGSGPASLPVNISYWHGHEMLVGFVMASVAGFALTAVATWTGRPQVQGAELILLVSSWLLGRVAMGMAGILPASAVAIADMLFPVLLTLLIGREVFSAGNGRNYPIVLIIAVLATANGFYHLGQLGAVSIHLPIDRIALYLIVHLALLLITVIGGRIVPNFTANWLRAQGKTSLPVSSPNVDLACVCFTIMTGAFAAFLPLSEATGWLAAGAAIFHSIRVSRWRGHLTTGEPLLVVLHVAYLWLPIGYALTACSVFGWLVSPSAALHALTMGAIGSMVLAVSTRVSLAHTGRKLHAPSLIVLAYWLLMLATAVRVGSGLGANYLALIALSAAGWMLAFAIFVWVYWPVLTRPRVEIDERI